MKEYAVSRKSWSQFWETTSMKWSKNKIHLSQERKRTDSRDSTRFASQTSLTSRLTTQVRLRSYNGSVWTTKLKTIQERAKCLRAHSQHFSKTIFTKSSAPSIFPHKIKCHQSASRARPYWRTKKSWRRIKRLCNWFAFLSTWISLIYLFQRKTSAKS